MRPGTFGFIPIGGLGLMIRRVEKAPVVGKEEKDEKPNGVGLAA